MEVFAVLLLEEGADARAILKATNAQLAPHQRIDGHWIWPDADFPRTPKLSVKRPELEKRVAVALHATVAP